MTRILHRSWLLGVLVLSAACGGSGGTGKSTLDPNDDARTAYEKALLDFRRGDCLSA